MGTCICLATRPTIWMHDRPPLESAVVSFHGPLSLRDEITGPRSCGPAHQQNQEGPPLRGWRVSSQHVRRQLALQSPWEGSDTWSGDSPKQHVSTSQVTLTFHAFLSHRLCGVMHLGKPRAKAGSCGCLGGRPMCSVFGSQFSDPGSVEHALSTWLGSGVKIH